MKNFNDYQAFTKSLATYNTDVCMYSPVTGVHLDYPLPYMYPLLAIAEEAGEVCGKVAKFVRKSLSQPSNVVQLREDVGKELGDLLYQVSECARQFGYTLEDIAAMNVAKLTDRKERGVIVGEGDNR